MAVANTMSEIELRISSCDACEEAEKLVDQVLENLPEMRDDGAGNGEVPDDDKPEPDSCENVKPPLSSTPQAGHDDEGLEDDKK